MKTEKKRLDLRLTELNLAQSRERARSLIMAGKVLVDDRPVDKPGTRVPDTAVITLRGQDLPYVSRGGLKLEGALRALSVPVEGKICLDVGASTGGFTDCLLQFGALRVYAVDVGYGQLAWKLRTDARVIPVERTNIRHMKPGDLPEIPNLTVIDASFISLKIVIPPVLPLIRPGSLILALVKPQFEVGRGKVGKGGVVRDPQMREETVLSLIEHFRKSGLSFQGKAESQVPGPKGNRETFILFRTGEEVAGNTP